MDYSILDIFGNVGVFLIILSYLLLQLGKLKSSDLIYSIMNLIGAALIILSLLENFNLSAFIVEAFWVLISLIGLFNFMIKKKISRANSI